MLLLFFLGSFLPRFFLLLQAPPPSRSSPERDSEIDFVAVDAKPMAIDTETVCGPTPSATCLD